MYVQDAHSAPSISYSLHQLNFGQTDPWTPMLAQEYLLTMLTLKFLQFLEKFGFAQGGQGLSPWALLHQLSILI
jgi:hypothetical protein